MEKNWEIVRHLQYKELHGIAWHYELIVRQIAQHFGFFYYT